MSYVTLADLGQVPAPRSPAPRNPTVAEKVALTAMVKQIEDFGNENVKMAWKTYQDFIASSRPFNGWSDSCSNGIFSSCAGGEYDTMHSLVSRVGQVIGGFTQVMSYDEMSRMLDEIGVGLSRITPGGQFNPFGDPGARRLIALFGGPVGWAALYANPRSTDLVFANQQLQRTALDLLVIARDSRRITPAQFAALMAKAEQLWRTGIRVQTRADTEGSGVNASLGVVECLYMANGPMEMWNCLPTWGKVVVGVVGVGVVVVPALYVVTVFAPLIRAGGNVAERLTRKNPSTCDRCGGQAVSTIMSRFNTDTICPSCEKREKAHPRYAEARDAELKQVQAGNYNFPGIGLPLELRRDIT